MSVLVVVIHFRVGFLEFYERANAASCGMKSNLKHWEHALRQQKSAEVEHESRVCRLTSQESLCASVLQLAFSTSAFSDLSQSTVLLAILNSQKSISCCTSLLLSPPASAAKQNGTQAPSTVCCTSPYNLHYTSENHVSYSTSFVASSNKALGSSSLLEREQPIGMKLE